MTDPRQPPGTPQNPRPAVPLPGTGAPRAAAPLPGSGPAPSNAAPKPAVPLPGQAAPRPAVPLPGQGAPRQAAPLPGSSPAPSSAAPKPAVPLPGQGAPKAPAPLPGTGPAPSSAAPRAPAPLPGAAVPKAPAPLPGTAVPKAPAPLPGTAVPAPAVALAEDLDIGLVAVEEEPAKPAAVIVPEAPKPVAAAPVIVPEAPKPAAPVLVAEAPKPVAAAPVLVTEEPRPVEAPAPAPSGEAPPAAAAPSTPMRSLPPEYQSDAVKKHTGGAPAPLRMMAARGLAPIPPRDLVHVVYVLTTDADPKIAEAANKSFSTFPDRILQAVLAEKIAPQVLDLFAEKLVDNAKWMETILLNRNTSDETYSKVARASSNETVITLVANNQERIMRHLDIVRSLKNNPHTLKSTLENVIDFLVRNGTVLDDIPEFAESVSRLGKVELEAAMENVEVPFELLSPDLQEKLRQQGKAPADFKGPTTKDEGKEKDAENLSLEELEKLTEENENTDSMERETINQKIAKLNTAQKIALAMKGNKEVRSILIRETNKLIAEAVVKSPRLTPQEVVQFANSRSINDVVIRYIANNREMVRSYGVKLALVNNPKAPLPVAQRFLPLLRESDIKAVAKSKSVSGAISQAAIRMVKAKMK